MGLAAEANQSTASVSAPRLRLLGGFRLTTDDAGLVTISRPAQRLLAYLALHHERPVQRTVLWERLWGEADPLHASSSLRSTLWRLPRVHGRPLVDTTASDVRLDDIVTVDLWDSQECARDLVHGSVEGRLDEHRRLCELFSLDLLPDWYDDWLLVEQETHRQLRLHALENLSSALRRSGRHTAALLAALAAVGGEPLRESAHRNVIAAHLAEGNAAEALRQYQHYRRLLAAELGLPPSPAIRHLVAPLLGRPLDAAG